MGRKDIKMITPSTKSKQHMPVIAKAKGKYVWDVDGKKYLDFTGANLTTVLGYRPTLPSVPNYPGVSDTEQELTKLLSSYTGNKHWRYFKNGHNAVDCAIRLARHILKKPEAHICFVGYAGASDAYVHTTNNKNGVPHVNSYQLKNGDELTPRTGLSWGTAKQYESTFTIYVTARSIDDATVKVKGILQPGICFSNIKEVE